MNLKDKAESILSVIETLEKGYEDATMATALTIRDMCVRSNGNVIVAGNGGSAAQSEHFVAELLGRFKKDREPINAVSLTANTATITALANDYGYENVFSRQLEALVTEKSMVFLFSTSGTSPNILKAAELAHNLGAAVLTFTGVNYKPLKPFSTYQFMIPSNDTALIQEVHLMLIHSICEKLDNLL